MKLRTIHAYYRWLHPLLWGFVHVHSPAGKSYCCLHLDPGGWSLLLWVISTDKEAMLPHTALLCRFMYCLVDFNFHTQTALLDPPAARNPPGSRCVVPSAPVIGQSAPTEGSNRNWTLQCCTTLHRYEAHSAFCIAFAAYLNVEDIYIVICMVGL